jgi:hypothetical protein
MARTTRRTKAQRVKWRRFVRSLRIKPIHLTVYHLDDATFAKAGHTGTVAFWDDGSEDKLHRGIYLRESRSWCNRLEDLIHEIKHFYTDSRED